MIDHRIPLVDLHRHLDGNVRLSTIVDLAHRYGIDLPADTVEGLRPHVAIQDERAHDLMDFIGRFRYLTAVLVNADACRRVAYENVEDARNENLDHIELRFSPWFMAETHGLNPQAVVEAVVDGVAAGRRDFGVSVGLIGILSRTYGAETCLRELGALLACADHLVALDLAGDELNYPARWFEDHFRRARGAGLAVTVHAGEADGPESVWSAIRDLGASRLGHGFRSVEDPSLLEYLAEQRIGLEISLTSNLHISAVSSYAEHPLKALLEHGVLANLNTDDPAISGINLAHEYEVAAPRAGLSREQIRRCQINGLEMAFLSDSERAAMVERKRGHVTSPG